MLSLLIAGCGGGGGSDGSDTGPTEKVVLTMTRTPAPEPVSNDYVTKDVAFGGEVAATGAKSVTLTLEPTCAGAKLAPTTHSLGATGGAFSLRSDTPLTEGTLCEVVVKAVATGASGLGTENSVVLKVHVAVQSGKVPGYSNVAIAAYDGSPVILSRTAPFIHPVENRTGLSGQWGMALGEAPTKDGHTLVLSRWFSENSAFRVTKIDPATWVQTAYTGVLPPGYEFNATGALTTPTKWHWCMNASCPPMYGGPWVSSPEPLNPFDFWTSDGQGGHFYAPFDATHDLWHLDASGVRTLLRAGEVSGVLKLFTVMHTYTYTPETN